MFRKMVEFFGPKPRGPRRVRPSRRSRSSTPDSSGKSGRSSGRTASTETSVKGSANVLVRLKSWFERTKSVPPEGFFSVDVGKEKIRYVIPIAYLSHEELQKLLDDSVAEFGHSHPGALQLACEEEELQEVLDSIRGQYEGEKEGEIERLIPGK